MRFSQWYWKSMVLWLGVLLCTMGFTIAMESNATKEDDFRTKIESDWSRQEERRGRTMATPEAIQDAWKHSESLYYDLTQNESSAIDFRPYTQTLDRCRGTFEKLDQLNEDARISLYKTIRWATRELALENPLVKNKPLVFLKRNRFACQMMHEYLGYYYEQMNTTGGDLCILENPGHTFELHSVIGDQLPPGVFQTLSLSYDGQTAYFAYVKADYDPNKPRIGWLQLGNHDFHQTALEKLEQEDGKFQIYEIRVDGTNLRQLTVGKNDNFDPTPLPDGGIAFLSTNRGGFVRCNNPWEPLPVYTVHRMNADGGDFRILSYHETNEWHPTVLNDGRLAYCRWDYMDRSAAHYHGIWTSNPDGTNPSILFGNYTQKVSACYQPRAIPGSRKVLFVAGSHHADTGGSLVLVDPSKAKYDPQTVEDRLESLECITPEVPFPETPDQRIQTYYHSPWPLSEKYFYTSYSHEPLGCFFAGSNDVGRTGLYYYDAFGNLELLYEDETIACQYPIPLESRSVPPVIPSVLNSNESGNTGELVLSNVHQSTVSLDANRPIKELRIFQILPKWPYWTANQPKLGYANAESARLLLGSVPVESDGSAYFRVPAGKMLYFQAVDADGKAVQTMRSILYMQPGERRTCVGCHEPIPQSPSKSATSILATRREPSMIQAGPDGTAPWSYTRLVQPILDAKCVSCHHAGDGAKTPDLTGNFTIRPNEFCDSFYHLRPYVRWYEWGGESIQQTTTLPNRCGADESPLMSILQDENHLNQVQLSDAERRNLYIWLDGNAAFYGTQDDANRQKQREGDVADIPEIQ